MTDWHTTELKLADRERWQELYAGYGAFYETPMPPEKLDRVWNWIHDPEHEVNAIVIRSSPDATAMGLAHYRPFARPLHGSVGCYLDDLFVDPQSRGTGAVDALLAGLARIAGRNGWDVVRWITRDSNVNARSAYDRLARKTDFLTYDLTPVRD